MSEPEPESGPERDRDPGGHDEDRARADEAEGARRAPSAPEDAPTDGDEALNPA